MIIILLVEVCLGLQNAYLELWKYRHSRCGNGFKASSR